MSIPALHCRYPDWGFNIDAFLSLIVALEKTLASPSLICHCQYTSWRKVSPEACLTDALEKRVYHSEGYYLGRKEEALLIGGGCHECASLVRYLRTAPQYEEGDIDSVCESRVARVIRGADNKTNYCKNEMGEEDKRR